jgi:hypothetical protein
MYVLKRHMSYCAGATVYEQGLAGDKISTSGAQEQGWMGDIDGFRDSAQWNRFNDGFMKIFI